MNWSDQDDQMLRADLRAREAHSEVMGPPQTLSGPEVFAAYQEAMSAANARPPEANQNPLEYWIGETRYFRELATDAYCEIAALQRRLRWWVLAVFALAVACLGLAARVWVK